MRAISFVAILALFRSVAWAECLLPNCTDFISVCDRLAEPKRSECIRDWIYITQNWGPRHGNPEIVSKISGTQDQLTIENVGMKVHEFDWWEDSPRYEVVVQLERAMALLERCTEFVRSFEDGDFDQGPILFWDTENKMWDIDVPPRLIRERQLRLDIDKFIKQMEDSK